ncbi:MAG TPA: zinc metallopeptidase [Gammaproteobacteria bacterium]|nr:zinc metallopeptidase [Gammaproteobacteria bacterium]
MYFLIIFLFILTLLYGPQWWAQYTFRRYAKPLERLQGTGGELARHLLDRFEMSHVEVEKTEPNSDHYDPTDKIVRLSPDNFDNKSLTAIAVAAHEVGHAIQDNRNEPLLAWRGRLAVFADAIQKFGVAAMMVMPVVTAVTRAPALGGVLFFIGIGSMFMASIVHLITLPVETDASFNKALPILESGYIETEDIPKVRRILRAAALTYLAGSLASLLNLWRWIAILKR